MQKINPLFLLLLLIILAVVIDIKKESFKNALVNNNKNISKLDKKLKDTVKLKNRWINSSKKLNSILNSSAYRGASISKESMGNKIITKIDKLNSSQMRQLINKILNSYILIKKIKIKKDGAQASLVVEIEK